jgi:alpha-amylase
MNSPQPIKPKSFLNLYFQVHQPKRLRNLGYFEIGSNQSNFNDELNEDIIRKVAKRCYLPTNLLLLKLIHRYPQVKVTFSISGVALEQFENYCPAVLESFRMLAATGSVEFLGETYYHSLCSLSEPHEFAFQVYKHSEAMQRLLGVKPTVFRNTELIYSDSLGHIIQQLGFTGVYLDGIEKILKARDPNVLYEHPTANGLNLFLRNYRLSDDIAFRFSDKTWKEYPLTAKKFVRWIEQSPGQKLVNLGMDYETFGEHQKPETGIFKFLADFIKIIATHKKISMVNPSEVNQILAAEDHISVPVPISWADRERDLSAWLGNDMQRDAFHSINNLKSDIEDIGNQALMDEWRNLQTSDHLYYMSTKKEDDGHVHQYFSHYPSPYEAFMNYMNAISDLEFKIRSARSLMLVKNQPNKKRKMVPTLSSLVENLSYIN